MEAATAVADGEPGVSTTDETGSAPAAIEEPEGSTLDETAGDAPHPGPMGRMRAAIGSLASRAAEGVRGTASYWGNATQLSWEQAGWMGRAAIGMVGAVVVAGVIASMSAGALLIGGVAVAGVAAGLTVNELRGGGALAATGRWLKRDFTPQRHSRESAAHEAPDMSPAVEAEAHAAPAAPALERDTLTGRLTKESLSFVRQQQYWRIEGREARGYRDALAEITEATSMEEAADIAGRALASASDQRLGRGRENQSYRWALEQIGDPTKNFIQGVGDARMLAAEAVTMYGPDSVALTNARPTRAVGTPAAVDLHATPAPREAVTPAARGAEGVAMAAAATRPARRVAPAASPGMEA